MLKKRKVIKRFVITTVRTNDRSIDGSIADRYNRFHLIILIFGCPHSGTLNIIIIIIIGSQSKVLPKTRPALCYFRCWRTVVVLVSATAVRFETRFELEWNLTSQKRNTNRCHVESILFGLFGGSLYSVFKTVLQPVTEKQRRRRRHKEEIGTTTTMYVFADRALCSWHLAERRLRLQLQ